MPEIVIKVENLYKKFCSHLKRSIFYGTLDITRNMLGIPYKLEKLRKKEFWVLKDVNFKLLRGESLGIVGINGAGKTTLLRLLTGIFPPDRGKITVKGRIGALIALGAGFHPHMTGKENIFLNGTILGMTKKEINKKFDEIVDFADIGDFLNAPVASYSSGMKVRLGFAIAVQSKPDILLIDEVLAVGDVAFQKKCNKYLEDTLTKYGTSIILITHNIYAIKRICENAILLDKGEIKFNGRTGDVIPEYFKIIESYQKEIGNKSTLVQQKQGIGEIRTGNVYLYNENNKRVDEILVGENLKFEIEFNSIKNFKVVPVIYMKIYDSSNNVIFYSIISEKFLSKIKIKKGKNVIIWKVKSFNMAPGKYVFETKIGGRGDIVQDIHHEAKIFEVKGNDNYYKKTTGVGISYFEDEWKLG